MDDDTLDCHDLAVRDLAGFGRAMTALLARALPAAGIPVRSVTCREQSVDKRAVLDADRFGYCSCTTWPPRTWRSPPSRGHRQFAGHRSGL